MEAKGRDLIFIKRIEGDGSKVSVPKKELIKIEQGETFRLSCLSISNGTYIASSMSTYIVKLKDLSKVKALKSNLEDIFSKHHRGFGMYYAEDIVDEIIKLHKKDVVNANLEGIKLMRDTLSTLEAEEMANEYYKDNFEK